MTMSVKATLETWLLGSLGQGMFISPAAEKEGGWDFLGSQHRKIKACQTAHHCLQTVAKHPHH